MTNRDRDYIPPFYRALTILMYADDAPGKMPDEQVKHVPNISESQAEEWLALYAAYKSGLQPKRP